MIDTQDALQLAIVRLRLESVPHKVLHRENYSAWPFAEDSVVVFCRATPPDFSAMVGNGYAMTGTMQPLYMMSDGVEHQLVTAHGHAVFAAAALNTRNLWMASGFTT